MSGLFHNQNRLHLILVMIAILTSSFASSAPTLAAASAAQPLCLDGKIWDEEAETCVDLEEEVPTETPEPTAEPTEEPVATIEPTEEPEQPAEPTEATDGTMDDESDDDAELVPADDNTASIVMFSRSCPNGFNLQNASADERNAACVGSAIGASFSLDVEYVPYGSVLASGGANGNGWYDVALGTATITMVAPATHTGPGAARCVKLEASGEQPFIDFFFNSFQSGLSVELEPFDSWQCYAFFNELPTGSITLALHDCDKGIDISGTAAEILKAYCNEMLPNVVYTLEHIVVGTSTTTTSDFSKAIFHRVPEGTARIRIDAPEDYGQHRVFCETIGPEGQTLHQYQQVEVGDDLSIAVTFDDLETTFCDWYTGEDIDGLPLTDEFLEGSPTAEADETDAESNDDTAIAPSDDNSAQIFMYSFECPDGFDFPNAADFGECEQGWLAYVRYDLTVDGAEFDSKHSRDGVGGVGWSDLPLGVATISTTPPPSHSGPFHVSCETHPDSPTNKVDRFTLAPNSGGFGIELEAGDIWLCTTFLTVKPTGSVTATLLECPPELDILNTDPNTLKSACRGFLPNVEFMLMHDVAGSSVTYTSDFSKAIFHRVAEGSARMRMSVPEGYGLPRVFCETIGPDGQTLRQYDQEFVENDASIAVSFDDLETTFCNWYTVQGGIPVELPDESLGDQGFPIGTPVTDQQAVAIDDVDQAEQPLPTSTPDFGIETEIEAIEDIDTVALPDDSPGKVTIIASMCPVDFDAVRASARDFNLNCPYIKEDIVEFSLTDSSGTFDLQHTEQGLPLVEFETVAPGSIEVVAAGPIGSGEPAVFCQTSPADGGAATPYTRQEVNDGSVLLMVVEPSSLTVCDWFIVQFDQE